MTLAANHSAISLQRILLCGGMVVTLSMGIRHGFGMWQQPITGEYGWSRESFSFALAVQNLVWGASQPIVGMLADKFSARRVLLLGALLYALGIALMSMSATPALFALSAGVLLGIAQSCTTYTIIYGIIGRNCSPAQRSSAMGIAAAAGSFGQFLMLPVERLLITHFGWQSALWILSAAVLLIAPLAWLLREPERVAAASTQSISQALAQACGNRSFQLLMISYFVCGFQVVFIGVHLPSYLKDNGLGPEVAAWALALVGLFNVFGTYAAGQLGTRLQKRWILAFIYFTRAIIIGLFLLAPLSALSVYLFAGAMGALWLSTVPPTNAVVAQMFGQQHFGLLAGFVFLSHQIGSFLGVWLGGKLFDAFGNYNLVWGITIALGLIAALALVPVDEGPIERRAVPA